MARVWKILSTHLGVPPERFDYRVDGKPTKNDGIKTTKTKVTTMTPLDFAKDVAGFDPDDYVSVASYPNKKDDTVYEIKKSAIGKTRPGEPTFDLRFLNVSPARMEQLAAASIKGGQAVWFAAEVRQDVDHKTGVMHPGVYDRASVYQFSKDEEAPALSRKENGYFQQVVADHAMLLTGYDQPDPDGPIVKFKVENSWGDKYGSEGIYHLYHDWFVKNVFEVVVNKKFLSESELALWKGKAKRTKRKD